MAKNTKILIIILALLLIALIGVLICKKNANLSGNQPVWNRGKDNTSNEVETPNEVFDENIVQIVSGEIILSEEETATFYYPQLVGNTEDIQHANEEIKQLYT